MKNLLTLQVKAIRAETSDAKTFVLQSVDNQMIRYEAGQFLTFIFATNSGEKRRSYSLSSTFGIDNLPSITVKRVSNGEISRFWLDKIQVGDTLQALPPAGRFTLTTDSQNQRDIFLLGAGSGITPLFSLLKKILHHEPQSRIHLIYSNKNELQTIFFSQLTQLQSQYANQLTINHLYSNPLPESGLLPTHLSNTYLETWVKQALQYESSKAEFFLCGPENLMRMQKMVLRFMGFHQEQIHQENFTIPDIKPLIPYSPTQDTKQVIINYQSVSYSLSVPYDKNILEAALAQGIELPYSCRGGRCATCQAKCTEGKVKMSINDVLTERELAEGWILTCTAYVQTPKVSLTVE
ncbi:MAG: ferredoxin--NADP reductase [Microscillaceae bacterium]|jgi:ring-1,2-phenylacetyl-CoA epoxidase subunit PaaE|nr:ferredoxin--NADP reductase [Microscillaceae bacterium]